MADLKKQIEISADASGVEAGVGKAKRSLADLGASAAAAGKKASEGLSQAGDGGNAASAKFDRATQNIIGSIQRATAALEAGGRSSADYFRVLGEQRGISSDVLKPYLDALDAAQAKTRAATIAAVDFSKVTTSLGATGFAKSLEGVTTSPGATSFGEQAGELGKVADAAGKAGAALGAAGAKNVEYAMSARATAAALRQVPAQFTDIVTSLQAGQKPLTVLLQQGGQLKDVFGGIGPAARALGGYIASLITPLTVAAAAAGGLIYAFIQGREESQAYQKALILSGNAAGATVGQLNAMAKAISQVAGTQGNAAAAIAEFVTAGDVASQNLEKVALAAVQFERATGQAISKSVQQYAELAKAPLDATLKLNDSLHFLTLSTYSQIKALEDQGRVSDAAALAQKTYADAQLAASKQIESNLGLVERAWLKVKDAAGGAWNAMINVGRASTLQDQLASAQAALAQREAQGGPRRGTLRSQSSYDADNQALRDRIGVLQESISLENRAAASRKAANDQLQARVKFDKDGEQFLTNQQKAEREIAKARNEGAAAGATQLEIEQRVAAIREKYKDRSVLGIDKAQLQGDIDAIQKASDKLTKLFGDQEKVLEAQRAAGGLSDAEYYQKKREFIIADAEVQEYALQQQVKRYEQERLTGKEAIDNQRKIADTEAKIVILRADSAAKLDILSIQQEAAAKRLALAFLTARQAAQDYFDGIQRQQARDLSGIGRGTEVRNFNSGLNQIEDRYAQQRRDLENQKAQLELEGKFTDEAQKQYAERLRIINEFQQKSIDSYRDYYDELKKQQADFSNGANEAIANYLSNAANVAKATEDLTGKALNGIEDAFVDLAVKGSANFKQLANSIIADLIRIQVRSEIAGLLGSGSGGSSGLISQLLSAGLNYFGGGYSFNGGVGTTNAAGISGGRAIGGPVSAGGIYRVNENGPEILKAGGKQYLMMGGQGGSVEPGATWGGSSVTVHNTFVLQQPADRSTQDQIARRAGQSVNRAIARNS